MFYKKINLDLVKKNRIELSFFFILISISIFFRVYNLEFWRLPSRDESILIYHSNKPIIDSIINFYDISKTFFPSVLWVNFFPFVNTFIEYRYFAAMTTVLGFIILYFTLKKISNWKIALFLSLFFCVNYNILYVSRMFLVDMLDLVFVPLILFFYIKWYQNRDIKYTYLVFIFLGLSLINHLILIYFVTIFLLWFIFLLWKKEVDLRTFLISLMFFLIILSSFLPKYVKFFYTSFSDYMSYRYAISGLKGQNFFMNFMDPLQFFDKLFIFFTSKNILNQFLNINIFLDVIVLFIFFYPFILFLFFKLKHKKFKKISYFLYFISYGIFLIIFLSIIPITFIQHFTFFYIPFLCILAHLLTYKTKLTKILILVIIPVIILNFVLSLLLINNNSYSTLQKIWPKKINRIMIDGPAYATLEYTYFLNNYEIYIFHTTREGIYSVPKDNTNNYTFANFRRFVLFDPNFFIEKNITKNDIIITVNDIIDLYGDISKGPDDVLNNDYFRINVSLEYIGNVDNIEIFRVI